jgi:patatin-like phospholipase domain-containing protein 2
MDDDQNYTLSFSGCGFLCIYHTGVIAAINEYAPQLTRNKICGASAGSIAAAGIVCNVCISKAVSTILAIVSQARSKLLGPIDSDFHLMKLVEAGLQESLPLNAHELCTGKLQISLTRLSDRANVVVSEYPTRQDLIDAIICSCFIPFYCGRTAPKFLGIQYYDGGVTDNQPIVDARTITVSPFCGESDICPPDIDSASLFGFDFNGTSIRFTSQNLFRMLSTLIPPTPENCSRICRQGFEDALRFLTRSGMTPCARCLTIQSSALPLPKYDSYIKTRNSSSVSLITRARIGSECDMCFDKVEPKINSSVTTILFPPIVQRTLDEAAAAENWVINYMFKFRVIRYTWRAMLPAILPMQYALFGLRKIAAWIASLPYLDAMLCRFKEMLLFVASEIERIHGPITRLSCYFSLTEVKKPTSSPSQIVVPAAPIITPDAAYASSFDEEDSINQLVQYSQDHDAVLAFYYTDDHNRTQVCEIFDIENPNRISTCHSTSCHKNHGHTTPLPPLIPEDDDEMEPADIQNVAINTPGFAEDSGLSLTEDNSIPNNIKLL